MELLNVQLLDFPVDDQWSELKEGELFFHAAGNGNVNSELDLYRCCQCGAAKVEQRSGDLRKGEDAVFKNRRKSHDAGALPGSTGVKSVVFARIC